MGYNELVNKYKRGEEEKYGCSRERYRRRND